MFSQLNLAVFFASQEQLERQGSESAAALQVAKLWGKIGGNFGGKKNPPPFFWSFIFFVGNGGSPISYVGLLEGKL